MKIGYLFSGQGQQFADMGKDFYESEPLYKEVIDQASKALNLDLSDSDKLNNPENTQVSILAMSYGINRLIETIGLKPIAMTGLSLGEYSALVSAEALSFDLGLKLVSDRSKYMDEAGLENPGKMAAVLKIDPKLVVEVCNEIDGVYPANFNTKDQTVIGGTVQGVKEATDKLLEKGAKRVVPLNVKVSSHTPLMQSASDKLYQRLQQVDFKEPKFPVISNTTKESFNVTSIKEVLRDQLVTPTHFYEDLEKMVEDYDVDTLIEIGPGDTLSKFAKKTYKNLKIFNVDSIDKFNKLKEELTTGENN
ncbi:acyltransferase domain-containing protein [Lactobacillus sp. S2-2]|uniref:ACP S-malonyltransferase n=1 Tax=Lactobacillus sp. S2-2 TaxID=2692917 RepID=UPI001F3431FE|nr:ACP S-malonyltransferase [Lactobacillus sp. S2-2]MCF6514658.1 acyltransferase domain-containing protein [Lactobacillus sp. S2-2]